MALFGSAGSEVNGISLLGQSGGRLPRSLPAGVAGWIKGEAVPESLAWSPKELTRRLEEMDPDVTVVVGARCYSKKAAEVSRVTILDLVDRLSESYLQRSRLERRRLVRSGYSLLSHQMRRFEENLPKEVDRVVAAGVRDSELLQVEWVPILLRTTSHPPARAPDHDLVFVGNLGYGPNVDALRWLDELWPTLRSARSDITLLVAGARPSAEVVTLAGSNGWTLVRDFASVKDVLSKGRVSIAPLRYATGMQIKILDAAEAFKPVIASSVAMQGYPPDCPAVVADSEEGFVDAVRLLLSDAAGRDASGRDLGRWARRRMAVDTWTPWAREVLDQGRRRR